MVAVLGDSPSGRRGTMGEELMREPEHIDTQLEYAHVLGTDSVCRAPSPSDLFVKTALCFQRKSWLPSLRLWVIWISKKHDGHKTTRRQLQDN